MGKNELEYFEWEGAVVEEVADALDICHSDATGVVEAQQLCMQQSWRLKLDAKQTAIKILAEACQ